MADCLSCRFLNRSYFVCRYGEPSFYGKQCDRYMRISEEEFRRLELWRRIVH